jgi:hypothetical protein
MGFNIFRKNREGNKGPWDWVLGAGSWGSGGFPQRLVPSTQSLTPNSQPRVPLLTPDTWHLTPSFPLSPCIAG